jgi:hypothetical protein
MSNRSVIHPAIAPLCPAKCDLYCGAVLQRQRLGSVYRRRLFTDYGRVTGHPEVSTRRIVTSGLPTLPAT